MAEFSKYGATSVGRLFLHNNRMSNDGVTHSNESIDKERTIYNYHLKRGSVSDVQKRLDEVFSQKRSNATVLGEIIVTLPQNVKASDERDFFQAVYDFYAQDFGEENIMNAVVHKDEKTPHLHLDFIPVVKMNGVPEMGRNHYQDWIDEHGEEPTEKLCCREKITRAYLSSMHHRLSDFVTEYLGYETAILNGATVNGNRTVLQLKADSLKKEIEEMERQKKHLGNEINSMLTVAKKHGIEKEDVGLYPLMQKIEDLANQNAVLRNIITRQSYPWKREDLEAIQAKKYVPSKSLPVSVFDGSLVDAEIDKNAVVIIELPNEVPRPLPQRKLIESDGDLERQARFVQSSTKAVMCRQSRTSERIYIFVKTDNTEQTMLNLLQMEKQLRELDLKNRRVYMDRIANDTFDFARSVLSQNGAETLYFTGRVEEEKTKDEAREENKEMTL